MDVLTVACIGLAIAAASGFRAFLPLAGLALLQRSGLALPMSESYDWLASDTALWILGTACLLEILADKVPLIDNVLDAVGLVVRPAAGALAVLAATSGLGPEFSLLAAVLAVPVTGSIAATKAAARGASTASTGGVANPVLSLQEDAFAGTTLVLAALVPLLVPVFLVLLFLFLRRLFRRLKAAGGVRAALRRRLRRPSGTVRP
ncbi:DUF4126 domain-containing protein [Parvularcula dongshanensis]|uniref:DUF4126 domain-containing protein n=1 Tax=Parvularcula dongshanensis TaxID=1173995 RepID=A0A840I3H7_9PROT|nr:DUF4126 domain-containing protein [Parvularcula dongshanensis]MBB4658831.1 hypothetical protein [Parvularcula dongshanensis]